MSRTLALDGEGRLANRVFLDDQRIGDVLALLNRDGEQARVVGGAVRNALLGLAPGDIDITTTALPDAVMARAKAARLRVIPTGVPHGTVTVVVRGLPLEITTLRLDVETDGRHAVVRFGRDFAEDAQRRDFTVNALSVDNEGRLHDTTGGLADLAAGRVRFIGEATTRIREDYLRILRFFRFSASYATGALDAEGLAACAAERDGLARLSRERVRVEFLKLLVAPRAVAAVDAMAGADILSRIIDLTCRPERLARLAAVEEAGGWTPDALRRLWGLAVDGAQDVETLRDRLRLSNEERDRLARLTEAVLAPPPRSGPPDEAEILRDLHAFGRGVTTDAVLLRHAESRAAPNDATWRAAARRADTAPIPVLPVSGATLLGRGLKAGPLVGAVLKDVQARWIRTGFASDPATLQRLLDDAIAAATPVRNDP